MPLRRSDLFGFVPGGPVLEAEEAYGEDWDPRRGGRVLDAEEEYSFSLSGDDDEDFGADSGMSDIPLFSDSFGGDETDDQLDQILSDLESDEFGADPMQISPSLEPYVDQLDDLIAKGAQDAIMARQDDLPSLFNASMGMLRKAAQKFSNFFTPGDLKEIAHALMADPAFCEWPSLSQEQQSGTVHQAIYASMWPGVESKSDDMASHAMDQAWDQLSSADVASLSSNLFEVFLTATTEDLPKAFYAGLAENPVLGNAMQMMGWDPANDDQALNVQAAALWLFGKIGFDIDGAIAAQISDNGEQIVQACRGAVEQSGPVEVVSVEVEQISDLLPAPVQEMSDSGYFAWDPTQILAAGYGMSILGSLTKIF